VSDAGILIPEEDSLIITGSSTTCAIQGNPRVERGITRKTIQEVTGMEVIDI